jgi:hypothetical protein
VKANTQPLDGKISNAIDKAEAQSNAIEQRNLTSPYLSTVMESSGDEPWAEFCKALVRPAFLLPNTGFGDLE